MADTHFPDFGNSILVPDEILKKSNTALESLQYITMSVLAFSRMLVKSQVLCLDRRILVLAVKPSTCGKEQ
jgi:hypothetical protein